MLNIKNPEAHELAKELAGKLGVSMTEAVIDALHARLKQQASEQPDDKLQAMRVIARQCAAEVKIPFRSEDHADFLYDEYGLPK